MTKFNGGEMSIVLCGSNCIELGKRIGAVNIEVKKFPDNETYVKIPIDVSNKEVFYIQSFFPNQNNALIEAFLTIDTLFEQGAKSVIPIFPYFPYTKQDKIFKQGEALSSKTLLKIFAEFGAEQIYFINAHFLKKEGPSQIYGLNALNMNAAPLLLPQQQDSLIILPGEGARYLLESAEGSKENIIFFKTKRSEEYKTTEGKTYREVEVDGDLTAVKNREVIVLDDMISTGGTMAKICEAAKQNSAAKVIAAAVHGLFVGSALEKLKTADEIITTDTVESKFSKISIAPLILKIIKG